MSYTWKEIYTERNTQEKNYARRGVRHGESYTERRFTKKSYAWREITHREESQMERSYAWEEVRRLIGTALGGQQS